MSFNVLPGQFKQKSVEKIWIFLMAWVSWLYLVNCHSYRFLPPF